MPVILHGERRGDRRGRLPILGAPLIFCVFIVSSAVAETLHEESVTVHGAPIHAGWKQFQVIDADGEPMPTLDARAVSIRSACPRAAGSIANVVVKRSSKPAALVVVADTSSSMAGESLVHEFLTALLSRMDGHDWLKLVTFGSETRQNEWATAGTYRRALLLRALRRLAKTAERPDCLREEVASNPGDRELEDWGNACSVDELQALLPMEYRRLVAVTLAPSGGSELSEAMAMAAGSLVTATSEGFIPAYDAQPGVLVISDFELAPPDQDVMADVDAIRRAFLVQMWTASVERSPTGLIGGARALRLIGLSPMDAADRLVQSLKTLHEATYDVVGLPLTAPGCVEASYVDALGNDAEYPGIQLTSIEDESAFLSRLLTDGVLVAAIAPFRPRKCSHSDDSHDREAHRRRGPGAPCGDSGALSGSLLDGPDRGSRRGRGGPGPR